MRNPNGPYPGRQLFIGLTVDKRAALTYLVTGRSPQSRERRATPLDNSIIVGPTGNQPYDPLRHYTAVKYNPRTGIAVVSNGIQTEAIFETYQLLLHTNSPANAHYIELLLDGARAEPDSMHTPRIAGVITCDNNTTPVFIIGIKRKDKPAAAFQVTPEPGTLIGISTYKGDIGNPKPFDPDTGLPKLQFHGNTAKELAKHLFGISSTHYEADDIRVCSVGGIRLDDSHKWELTIHNRHRG